MQREKAPSQNKKSNTLQSHRGPRRKKSQPSFVFFPRKKKPIVQLVKITKFNNNNNSWSAASEPPDTRRPLFLADDFFPLRKSSGRRGLWQHFLLLSRSLEDWIAGCHWVVGPSLQWQVRERQLVQSVPDRWRWGRRWVELRCREVGGGSGRRIDTVPLFFLFLFPSSSGWKRIRKCGGEREMDLEEKNLKIFILEKR